jgi:homoserine O-acetyltransferase
MEKLHNIKIEKFKFQSGDTLDIDLSYQIFGQPLNDAPVIVVNHALTGNSQVCGKHGWWQDLIGPDKCIDTNIYTILAFNVPGNGYAPTNENQIKNHKIISARDIAHIFGIGLEKLKIDYLFAVIGGSVGGGIAWELAALYPKLIEHLIPIASDWKATDWLIANCHIQEAILLHSRNPLADARMHAMTLYRTPESFSHKFKRSRNDTGIFNAASWLNHHGLKLQERFQLSAYKIMNQILMTIDITKDRGNFINVASQIKANIHIITINSDLFFKPEENWSSYVELKSVKENVWIHELKSIHGHDAFLIEFDQLQRFLRPIFSPTKSAKADIPLIHKCA